MKGRIKEILHGAMAFFAEIEFRFPVTVQNSIMEFSLFSTFIKIILGGYLYVQTLAYAKFIHLPKQEEVFWL